MDDLRAAHLANGGKLEMEMNGKIEDEIDVTRLEDPNQISAVNRVWGGDNRLSLYGYTLETINLLLLPMIQTK